MRMEIKLLMDSHMQVSLICTHYVVKDSELQFEEDCGRD